MAALGAELRPKQEERLAGLRDMDAFAVARDAAAGIQFSVNIRANVLESLNLHEVFPSIQALQCQFECIYLQSLVPCYHAHPVFTLTCMMANLCQYCS